MVDKDLKLTGKINIFKVLIWIHDLVTAESPLSHC